MHKGDGMGKWCATALAVSMAWMTVLAQAAGGPPFTDLDGRPSGIESFTGDGKWLVVMIWAHDCHVCNMEAESYAYFHETHADQDARVLGISMDGRAQQADIEAFIERHALPFPNLVGEPQAVMRHYMTLTGTPFLGTPTILLYDPQGTLKAAQAGAVPVEVIESFIAKNRGTASAPG